MESQLYSAVALALVGGQVFTSLPVCLAVPGHTHIGNDNHVLTFVGDKRLVLDGAECVG